MERVIVEPGAYEKFGVEARKSGTFHVLKVPTRASVLPTESLSNYRVQLHTRPPVVIYVHPNELREPDVIEKLGELADEA